MNDLQKFIGNCLEQNYNTDNLDMFVNIVKKYGAEYKSIGTLSVLFDTVLSYNMDLFDIFIKQNYSQSSMRFVLKLIKENKEISKISQSSEESGIDVNLVEFLISIYDTVKNINTTSFYYDHCLLDTYKYYIDKRNSLSNWQEYSISLNELIGQIGSIINNGKGYNPEDMKVLINYAFDNLERDDSLY